MNISAYNIGTMNLIIMKGVKWRICWYIYIYLHLMKDISGSHEWMMGWRRRKRNSWVDLTWELRECWVVNEWRMKMVDNNYLWPPQIEKDNYLYNFFFLFLWQLTKTVFWFTFTLLYAFHQPSLCQFLSFTASN